MLQYQPKLVQICPSAYGVDATSIRIGKSLVGGGGGGGDNRKVPLHALYDPLSWIQHWKDHSCFLDN